MIAPHGEQWGGENQEEKEENVCVGERKSYLGQSLRENMQALGCAIYRWSLASAVIISYSCDR